MSYPVLKVEVVEAAAKAAAARGVSEVARSPRGFATAYLGAGSYARLAPEWKAKREAFLARHLAQVRYNDESLWDNKGRPTRRHLALAVWAYSPEAKELRAWLKEAGFERSASDTDEEDEPYKRTRSADRRA